ncbi:nucleotidyltransferase [candidate division KSB1 bacterium]|nr:nucleotidyltransferase [candidate division KSB1 bacterium]
MANPFQYTLSEVVTFLDTQQLRYAIIGGIANQIWGQARFTYDIDLKILVPDLDYDRLRARLTTAFPEPGRPDLPLNPLIVSVKIHGILIDFLLATPGYEEELIQRAVIYRFYDMLLWVCTPEDLIIQKAIAGRSKDWQDILGVVTEQFTQLDQPYLEDWLRQFADILEQPAILTQYQQIRRQVISVRQIE